MSNKGKNPHRVLSSHWVVFHWSCLWAPVGISPLIFKTRRELQLYLLWSLFCLFNVQVTRHVGKGDGDAGRVCGCWGPRDVPCGRGRGWAKASEDRRGGCGSGCGCVRDKYTKAMDEVSQPHAAKAWAPTISSYSPQLPLAWLVLHFVTAAFPHSLLCLLLHTSFILYFYMDFFPMFLFIYLLFLHFFVGLFSSLSTSLLSPSSSLGRPHPCFWLTTYSFALGAAAVACLD